MKQYPNLPEYTHANVWPKDEVLPGFQTTFQSLCNFIVETAALVARACDSYAQKNVPDYQQGYLEHVVKNSISTKARLLHYFPAPESDASPNGGQASQEDDWCATHLDHGCLTGLTSAMFVDEAQNPPNAPEIRATAYDEPLPELDRSPDPNAGLYIHSRAGKVTKVNIPKDCLAFQTGEALEVITKGRFRAVPHFVKGAAPRPGARVARNTLAVFTQVSSENVRFRRRSCAGIRRPIATRGNQA